MKQAVADASLVCAERLLADGKKAEATLVYKSLCGEDQPKHVRLAATRGLLLWQGRRISVPTCRNNAPPLRWRGMRHKKFPREMSQLGRFPLRRYLSDGLATITL